MSDFGGLAAGCILVIISVALFEISKLARVRDSDWHVLISGVGAIVMVFAIVELAAAWVLMAMAGPPR